MENYSLVAATSFLVNLTYLKQLTISKQYEGHQGPKLFQELILNPCTDFFYPIITKFSTSCTTIHLSKKNMHLSMRMRKIPFLVNQLRNQEKTQIHGSCNLKSNNKPQYPLNIIEGQITKKGLQIVREPGKRNGSSGFSLDLIKNPPFC